MSPLVECPGLGEFLSGERERERKRKLERKLERKLKLSGGLCPFPPSSRLSVPSITA